MAKLNDYATFPQNPSLRHRAGTLAYSPAWVTGMFGGALNFNGTNSYVNLNNTSAMGPLKPPLPVTIAAWIKQDGRLPGDFRI